MAYGCKEKEAACKGMADGELIFDDWEKRKNDRPIGRFSWPKLIPVSK
jgi:hypothetical protein